MGLLVLPRTHVNYIFNLKTLNEVLMDISNLSVSELEKLQADAAVLIETKKEQAILDAFNAIEEVAEKVGMTVEELLQIGKAKNKKERKSVEPRYRNKDNFEETWTGRGKQPRWLVAAIEAGAKLEDFLI
jgi:DNA-binding protein H-NS